MSEAAAKKKIQQLQRAIVDGLEDVKGRDIRVFNTEHLSPLFERVVVASGNTNRQTKALAASVVDKVREAGFPRPRLEGEDNAEWIIVDCGPAVVHVMQPVIRQYYNLEEIWGDKPVRLGSRSAAAKKVPAAGTEAAAGQKPTAKKTVAKKATAKKAPAKKAASKAAASKTAAAKKTATPKVAARKAPAGKSSARQSE